MKQNNFQQMADILPLPPVETFSWLWLFGLLTIVIISIMIWRYLSNPYFKLNRQLQHNAVNTRQIAHTLAKLTNKQSIQQQLNKLRFQRETPDKQSLLALIKKLQHDQ
jgi:uncharacterized protein (DUF58 family)